MCVYAWLLAVLGAPRLPQAARLGANYTILLLLLLIIIMYKYIQYHTILYKLDHTIYTLYWYGLVWYTIYTTTIIIMIIIMIIMMIIMIMILPRPHRGGIIVYYYVILVYFTIPLVYFTIPYYIIHTRNHHLRNHRGLSVAFSDGLSVAVPMEFHMCCDVWCVIVCPECRAPVQQHAVAGEMASGSLFVVRFRC